MHICVTPNPAARLRPPRPPGRGGGEVKEAPWFHVSHGYVILNRFVVTVLGCVAAGAAAQSYPVKPIRIVVGFSPGGIADVSVRLAAPRLGEALGQQIIVENRPGASGAIATERVASAPADGYTLLAPTAADAVIPVMRAKLPYNLERDLAPVSLVAVAPFVLVVHPSVPARSVKDLIALARAQPGRLSYGSVGIGTTPHLSAEALKVMAGIDILHRTRRLHPRTLGIAIDCRTRSQYRTRQRQALEHRRQSRERRARIVVAPGGRRRNQHHRAVKAGQGCGQRIGQVGRRQVTAEAAHPCGAERRVALGAARHGCHRTAREQADHRRAEISAAYQ